MSTAVRAVGGGRNQDLNAGGWNSASRGQPGSAGVSRGQPGSAEVSRGQPRPAEPTGHRAAGGRRERAQRARSLPVARMTEQGLGPGPCGAWARELRLAWGEGPGVQRPGWRDAPRGRDAQHDPPAPAACGKGSFEQRRRRRRLTPSCRPLEREHAEAWGGAPRQGKGAGLLSTGHATLRVPWKVRRKAAPDRTLLRRRRVQLPCAVYH